MFSSSRSGRLAAGAMLLGASILLAGCANGPDAAPGQDVSPPSQDGPTADPALWGVDWAEFLADTPSAVESPGFWEKFSAAGALWMVNTEARTTIHGTVNGQDWVTVDLVAAGLPAEAKPVSNSHCDAGRVIDDRGDSFVLVFETSYGGSHPAGIATRTWLVEISSAGAVLSLQDSAAIGLEAMPPSEDGWDFRTECIGGFLDLPQGRMIVGGGQWWQPYLTSSYDIYSAVQAADGSWSVHSTNAPPLGGDNGNPKIVATLAYEGDAVMVTRPLVDDRSLSVWRSSDGRAWDVTRIEAIPEGEFELGMRYRLVSAGDGAPLVLLATWRKPDAGLVTSVWVSDDGRSWERSDFDEAGTAEPALITTMPAGLAVVFDLGATASLWTSPDGRAWTRSEAKIPYAAVFATAHEGGLVGVSKDKVRVSGLDWGPSS